jgi:hypothetical protein
MPVAHDGCTGAKKKKRWVRKGEDMMDLGRCRRCGTGITGEQQEYCPDCAADVRGKRGKGRWFLASTVITLLLIGAVYAYGGRNPWNFSWDALLGRPAAVVNGEPVSRSAMQERVNVSRRMLEREYGRELFAGERGSALLAELERDVLEKMVEEQLIAQEARRLNIVISDEQVNREMRKIGSEVYGTWENCQASLGEDGISPEYLAGHVRKLLLFREVNKVKTAGGSGQNAAGWLVQARQNAEVTVNRTAALRPVLSGGAGSCCGAGGGGGGQSSSVGDPVAPELKAKASAAALAEYRKTDPSGQQGAEARVIDYGCHVQVDIEQAGRIVKSYTYQDGQVAEN